MAQRTSGAQGGLNHGDVRQGPWWCPREPAKPYGRTPVYDLTTTPLFSFNFDGATGNINGFIFQVEGSGPVTTHDGDFCARFDKIGPDLGLFEARVGFGYDCGGGSAGSGTSYGYVETSDSCRVERLAAPLPGTLPLLALGLLGLVWLAVVRRSGIGRLAGPEPARQGSHGAASTGSPRIAELSVLPCASSASERVTPPLSAWSITKCTAPRWGSRKR